MSKRKFINKDLIREYDNSLELEIDESETDQSSNNLDLDDAQSSITPTVVEEEDTTINESHNTMPSSSNPVVESQVSNTIPLSTSNTNVPDKIIEFNTDQVLKNPKSNDFFVIQKKDGFYLKSRQNGEIEDKIETLNQIEVNLLTKILSNPNCKMLVIEIDENEKVLGAKTILTNNQMQVIDLEVDNNRKLFQDITNKVVTGISKINQDPISIETEELTQSVALPKTNVSTSSPSLVSESNNEQFTHSPSSKQDNTTSPKTRLHM